MLDYQNSRSYYFYYLKMPTDTTMSCLKLIHKKHCPIYVEEIEEAAITESVNVDPELDLDDE